MCRLWLEKSTSSTPFITKDSSSFPYFRYHHIFLFCRVEGTKLLASLHRALAPLVPLNPGFVLSLSSDGNALSLDMGAKRGSYEFTLDFPQQQVNVLSPVSGVFAYVFEAESGLWLSLAEDRHDLRGLVTRDILRHCIGCPAF